MLTRTISIRVRYGETDQMGVVYHANYASYCEVAREIFRQIGLSYKGLEDSGIMLPVTEPKLRFKAVYENCEMILLLKFHSCPISLFINIQRKERIAH